MKQGLLGLLALFLVAGLVLPSLAWAKEAGDAPIAGYDKGFFVQTPDEKFYLNIGGYIQGQFVGEINEKEANEATFRIRRARLKFKGHLYSKAFKYGLEYDFSGTKLLQAIVKYVHNKPFSILAGQEKIPFNLEALSSSSTLGFVDRSLAHSFFGYKDERDIGIQILGELLDGKLEYALAFLNGEGLNEVNFNPHFMYAGRLVYNIAGKHGKKFADTKNSQKPQVAFAVAGLYDNESPDDPDAAVPTIENVAKVTSSLSAKYVGLGFHSAFFYQNVGPLGAASMNDYGALAQLGYFVIPELLELGFRTVQVFAESDNDQAEYTAGVNYYFLKKGHRMKLQLDYSALTEEDGVTAGDDSLNHRVRAQLQFKL